MTDCKPQSLIVCVVWCFASAEVVISVTGGSPEPRTVFWRLFVPHAESEHRWYYTNEASMPWKPDLVHSSTITPARCFIGLRARLPSGICHQSVPSLHAKVSLFGLIRGALPIFSQVPVLLNQEPDSCFPWRTQGPSCRELPLADRGRKGARTLPEETFPFTFSSRKSHHPISLNRSFGVVFVYL